MVCHNGNELRGAESFLRKFVVPRLVKKFLRILWNPKVHYRDQKIPPLFAILSRVNSVPVIPSDFPKIQFNITHLRLDL
jgi:hypothetical protein